MIPEQYRGDLVDGSLRFMQMLCRVYGSELAMEFWAKLSDVIDPELKGLTFSAMLTGNIAGDIHISHFPNCINKIEVIKAIRTWDKRRLGLKEAKDLFDSCFYNNQPIKIEVYYEKSREARDEFTRLGCLP
jgi:hypothetical protein